VDLASTARACPNADLNACWTATARLDALTAEMVSANLAENANPVARRMTNAIKGETAMCASTKCAPQVAEPTAHRQPSALRHAEDAFLASVNRGAVASPAQRAPAALGTVVNAKIARALLRAAVCASWTAIAPQLAPNARAARAGTSKCIHTLSSVSIGKRNFRRVTPFLLFLSNRN